jgi:hypothetical protein
MKRYRTLSMDFDARATILMQEISTDWSPEVKAQWKRNKDQIIERLGAEFGTIRLHEKVQNFTDLGPAPLSLIAFHNRFFRQIRHAFTSGSFYPALTAACALGERVLNHLILLLREEFRATEQYKYVYRKDSFDNWDLAINTLESWGVLLPNVAQTFRELLEIRNRTLHFDPETEGNDRPLALEAIGKLVEIISGQFSAFGAQPWYIEGTLGACFVKRSFENVPFVAKVVLPNCHAVGPLHLLEHGPDGWIVLDDHNYEDRELTDEEFRDLFNNRNI